MKNEAVEYRLSIGGFTLIEVSHEPLEGARERHKEEVGQARLEAVEALADSAAQTPRPLTRDVVEKAMVAQVLAERGPIVRREMELFNAVRLPFFPKSHKKKSKA